MHAVLHIIKNIIKHFLLLSKAKKCYPHNLLNQSLHKSQRKKIKRLLQWRRKTAYVLDTYIPKERLYKYKNTRDKKIWKSDANPARKCTKSGGFVVEPDKYLSAAHDDRQPTLNAGRFPRA